jgi:heptosyltransferase-2
MSEGAQGFRILVQAPNWVGDVVMATPAFQALRTRYPEAHITYLVRHYLHELLQPAPWYDDLVAADPAQGFWGLRRLARQLRAQNFRLAVLFPNSFRSAVLAWWARIPRRVGYARDARGFLLTEPLHVPRSEDGRFLPHPMVTYYAKLAEHLGAAVEDRRLLLSVDDADRASLHELLVQQGYAPDRPTIVFIPGAKFGASKCWPPRYFAQLADRLLRAPACNLVVVCGPGEEAIGEAIEQLTPKEVIHVWREPLGLGRLKALVSESQLMVTNDTGPRHFAAAFDVPVVTLFGPTDQRWTDTGHPKEVALQMTGLDCLPCQLPRCPRNQECLEQLLPDQVFEAATELLRRYPPQATTTASSPVSRST